LQPFVRAPVEPLSAYPKKDEAETEGDLKLKTIGAAELQKHVFPLEIPAVLLRIWRAV